MHIEEEHEKIIFCGVCLLLMHDREYDLHCTTNFHKSGGTKMKNNPERQFREDIDSVINQLKLREVQFLRKKQGYQAGKSGDVPQ